jgi:hypothetical protein
VDEVIDGHPPSWDDEPEAVLRQQAGEVSGLEAPDSGGNAPHKILQYEGWVMLPNQTRQRYVQAFIDYSGNNHEAILALSIHEEPSWEERARYERELTELEDYERMEAEYQEVSGQLAMINEAIAANPDLPPESAGDLQTPPLPRPSPPSWYTPENPEPAPMKKEPVYMFSHGVCIEPPVGNLGYGFGLIEADYNRAANTVLSQYIDAASQANAHGYIVTDNVEFERPFSRQPGFINRISGVTGGELKNSIMPMNVPSANPQMIDLVERLYNWGQSAIQSPSVLSGEPGKSGETFRGLATRVEQATKQLSVATRKYAMFLANILKNNARINSIFMPDEEIFLVNNHLTGKPELLSAGRGLYQRPYSVSFRADLKFASDAQRIADVDQMIQAFLSIPQLQGDIPLLIRLLRKGLEARDQHDMVPYLGPELPPPETPLGMPSPEEQMQQQQMMMQQQPR